jgi:hypothetical protein
VLTEPSCRFSQDMTIIDTELPYSLVDLCFSIITTIMGAILMCLSAGYFAATMPPVILAVWGKIFICVVEVIADVKF